MTIPDSHDLERSAENDLALASEATPAPWRIEAGPTHLELRAPQQTERSVARVYRDIDAEFVALARTALPAWIRRAVAAESRADRLEAALGRHHGCTADQRPCPTCGLTLGAETLPPPPG